MDHHKILGVKADASKAEIKKAYRKLANRYHPDKPEADEDKFKEIKNSYEILSGKKKDTAQGQYQSSGSSSFDDMFRRTYGRSQQGQQVSQIHVQISLEEAITGGLRSSVAKIGTSCATCGGLGVNMETTSYCNDCGGYGKRYSQTPFSYTIPQNSIEGDQIQVKIDDNNVYIIVIVLRPHAEFERHGLNLVKKMEIPFIDLLLDSEIEIETIRKSKLKIKLPSCTYTSGSTMRLKGHGLQTKNMKGDMHVIIFVKIPESITDKQKEKLKEYKDLGK